MTSAPTTPIAATPAKLKNGNWGARVQSADVREGDTVTITTRAGKSWQAQVELVVWRGDDIAICATSSLDWPSTPAPSTSSEAISSVRGGARRDAGTNRRGGSCDNCGTYLAAGKGRLERCYADTGCMEHHDYDGWHLYCLDESACAARRAEARAAAERRQQRSARLAEIAAEVETTDPVTPAEWPKTYGADHTDWTHYDAAGHRGSPKHFERRWAIGPGGQVWWEHPQPNNADGWDSRWWRLDDEVAAEVRDLLTTD